jgi:hypothetical protein
MRFFLYILISLLFAAQTSAQQSDTLFFQGGDNTGRPVTGSLGESYTSSQDLSGEQGTVVADGVTIGGLTIPAGELPALVKDNAGAVYSVSADGTSTYTGRYDSSYAGLHEQEPSGTASVVFSAAAGQKYGFDPLHPLAAERPLIKQHYLNIGESYFPAKAITPGAADIVSYKISGAQEADVKFVNRDGFVFHSENGQLTLAGGPASDAQEILAVYEQGDQKHIAGALLLASYAPVERRAVLVLEGRAEVSDADRQVLESSLNSAFGQAGIRYKLEIDRSLQGVKWCGQVSCSFSPSGSARLSNDYTGDEKKIIDFYSGRAEIDPAAVYIFAIGEAIDNTGGDEGGLQGKMHFDKQFGFLYNMRRGADMEVQGRTLAHEIAHGQYKLYHIFDRMYLGDEAMYSPNLMSYSSLPVSNELNKMQWDILHDPGVTWGIFARDKDQEATSTEKVISKRDDYIKDSQTGIAIFISPAGLPISISPIGKVDIIDQVFNGDISTITDDQKVIYTKLPFGTLIAFKDATGVYSAVFNSDNKFLGYRNEATNTYKIESLSPSYTSPYKVNAINSSGNFYLFESKFYLSAYAQYYSGDLSSYKSEGTIEYQIETQKVRFSELSEEDYLSLVEKLTQQLNVKGTTDYLDFDSNFDLSNKDIALFKEDFNDRLKVFHTETGVQFFVDIVYSAHRLTADMLETLAEDVYKKSIWKNNDNIAYLIVAVWDGKVVSSTNGLKLVDLQYANKSYFSPARKYAGIPQTIEYPGIKGDIRDIVRETYKLMPKPLYQYFQFCRIDGVIIRNVVSETDKIGHEHIYENHFWYDNNIVRFQNIEGEFYSKKSAFVQLKSQWDQLQSNPLFTQNDQLKSQLEQAAEAYAVAKSDLELWLSVSLEEWVQRPDPKYGTDDLANAYLVAHILKESNIKEYHKEYVLNYLVDKNYFPYYVLSGLNTYIPSEAFFAPDYGEYVYYAIDGIGLVLSNFPVPYLDAFADLGGLLYASYRGDDFEIIAYSAGIAIPVVSTIAIKNLIKSKLFVRYGEEVLGGVQGVGSFLAKSGTELKTYLDDLVTLPAGKTYNGQFYKSINTDFHPSPNPQLIDDYATLNLDHRYSKVGESGYYVSQTNTGNLTEMGFSNGVPANYQRYRYDNVSINNMLELTDDAVRQQLGITDDMIKKLGEGKYEYTHVLGTWAKDYYKGIVYPGAQGGNYTNIIIFKQVDVDNAIGGLIANPL